MANAGFSLQLQSFPISGSTSRAGNSVSAYPVVVLLFVSLVREARAPKGFLQATAWISFRCGDSDQKWPNCSPRGFPPKIPSQFLSPWLVPLVSLTQGTNQRQASRCFTHPAPGSEGQEPQRRERGASGRVVSRSIAGGQRISEDMSPKKRNIPLKQIHSPCARCTQKVPT